MKLTFLILSDYNKNKISLLVLTVLLFSCLAGNAKEQKASYQDDQIIITKSNSADKIIRITGKVTDTNGEPIIGANVSTKGTTLGTITDINGSFLLDVPSETVISISYIGYLTQEVKVKQQTSLNIVLKEDTQALEEVVVVGYGTVKRANLGGAVATADAKAFEARPVQNAVTALQGEVPGLTITRSGGGAPGAETTMKIRDVSSINGGTPLVLIDGAEGDINLINPSDIENVSVLKDGTAAIYGARASDGVVLITTKSGKRNQKTTVSFDAYYSVKTPALLKKTASLLQHAEMALEITDGSFPIEYTKEDLELIRQNSDQILTGVEWGRWGNIYPKFFKNQDWNDIVIGNGNMQNYNVNISGGGERYSYLVSLGHQREEGLPKFGKDLNKRYFVRAKSSIEIFKNLTYDLNLAYEASNRDYSSGLTEGQNIWELIYKTRSWTPLRNPAGNFYTFEGFDNPAQVLEEGGMANKTTGNVTVNNQLRWNVIDGLDLVGQAVIRKYDFDENVTNKIIYSRNWEDVNHRTARTPNNAERRYSKTLSKNFTLYADYKKNFNDLHDLSVMVGTSHESQNYDKFTAKRINFDQQENMSLQLGGSENQSAWSEGNAWTINSFFSRVNYTFKNRYIIEGTLRADGSSRFDPDHRWGYFPGVNAAWRLGEEGFMKNLNLFDDLKVRASYGEMGNQSGIGLYDYIQLISLSSDYYPFGGGTKGQMAKSGNIVSTSRTWETIQTTNIGLDFATLKNRLYGSFDYFWKENKNMLIPKTYPSMLGADAPSTNSGHLSIRGWEVALGWRDQINDFSYSVRFNLSDARNQVVERVGSNLIKLGLNETPTDYPLNSFFGYEFDGIIQDEQELKDYIARFPNGGIPGDLSVGDAKYKDLDGDGKLSVLGDGKEGSGDVKYLGDKNPRYNFGMNLSATYKGFDFSAFIQGVGRRTMFLEGEASKPMAEAWFQSAAYWYGKTWTAERTDAQYPAITSTSKRGYNYYYSTNTKHNVGYARLKNLQLGYTIPSSVTAKIGLQKLRVYFSGEDLFEIHNTPGGWDPEEDGQITSYPFARNYSFGVNVVF
ncbi:SusC/RagA family TonB-linked outer membrane protein [Parabacteroides faecis]|uniref:TonB-linked SusC/RagA family outer membrane protein n=1 Tax=Parabacteroides faecis TaxID=1217282 RepID=A0ABR6KKL4_9BACT|nr:TonB-dependent receptor [Parabacteroides faecis]MBB4622050.1 TonB-linked SusC/RagA family outer membrane protein [Parabacteroides faecis]GGJ81712.1 SusC/RagA family TonB-linked outer membrane protein [Parabacteroides faecis]